MLDLSEEESKKTNIRLWKGPFVSSGKAIRLSVNMLFLKCLVFFSCILLLAKPYFSLPFDTSSLSSYYVYLDMSLL